MSFYKKQLIGGYWQVSKPLARYFGCLFTPIVLDELIFHECKFADQDGWFFYSVEKLEENCLIGDKRRKNCFKKLIDSGILVIERRGLPCRNWYKINGEIIDKIINSVQPKPVLKNNSNDHISSINEEISIEFNHKSSISTPPVRAKEETSPPTGKAPSPPTGPGAILYNNVFNNKLLKDSEDKSISEDKTLVSKEMPNINTVDNCSLNDQIYKKDYSKIKRFLREYLISFNSSQIAKILYEFGSFDTFEDWFNENLDDETFGDMKKMDIVKIMASRILSQIRE